MEQKVKANIMENGWLRAITKNLECKLQYQHQMLDHNVCGTTKDGKIETYAEGRILLGGDEVNTHEEGQPERPGCVDLHVLYYT